MRILTALKTFTILAVLLAGGTALAMAQNGPATGGERPVAGGANGGGPAYGGGLPPGFDDIAKLDVPSILATRWRVTSPTCSV
jgi:hypothetical protein